MNTGNCRGIDEMGASLMYKKPFDEDSMKAGPTYGYDLRGCAF
jgi:hypothetical protein